MLECSRLDGTKIQY